MSDQPAANHGHRLNTTNIIVAVGGVVLGTFISPLFSDRMAVEHRMATMEESITELRRSCEDSDRMQKQFHTDMQSIRKEMEAIESELKMRPKR